MGGPAANSATAEPKSRRSKRSGSGIPCYEFFVHRSGTIDSVTIHGLTPSEVSAHAVRAWKALSPLKRADIIQQAKEEELMGKATSTEILGAVSELAGVSSGQEANSAAADDVVEPMIVVRTADDISGTSANGIGPADANPAGEDMDTDDDVVVVVDSDGNRADGATVLEADAEVDIDAALVEATAKYKAADTALKELRAQLKRAKKKDDKAVKKAESERKKLHEVMRRIDMSVQQRNMLKAYDNGKSARPERKPAVRISDDLKPALGIEEWVEVAEDLSIGMNRPFGRGNVKAVRGVGGATLADVQYVEPYGRSMHKDVPLSAITAMGYDWNEESIAKGKSKRAAPAQVQEKDTVESTRPPKKKRDTRSPAQKIADDLIDGYSKGLGMGWMRKRLGMSDGKGRLNDREKKELFGQAIALESYIAGSGGNRHGDTYVASGQFKPRTNKWNPLTTSYLVVYAWDKNNSYLSSLRDESKKNAIAQGASPEDVEVQWAYCPKAPKEGKASRPKSAIDDLGIAKVYFTPARLYAINKCREEKEDCYDSIDRNASDKMLNMYLQEYDTLDADAKHRWEFVQRNHIKRQPYIKHEIVEALIRNPQRSFRGLEADIGFWTSHKSIERWMKSFDSFQFYRERICPLLSKAQRKKHLTYAKFVLNLWGLKDENGNLPNGKKRIMLIHYDEKWFWGLVLRAYAKACEELGLQKRDYATFHRSHINKVMAIAFVGAVFTDTLENGCEIVKLPMVRAQAYKIAERAQYETVTMPDGSKKRPKTNPDGTAKTPVRKKGDAYPVDCCVTGANEGTKKDPKCPLLLVFKHVIFPKILEKVGPGCEYEDCHVVIQGDQAGPHEDMAFCKYVKDFCAEQGWTWAPQAPQMPHGNVLDLSVFPCMSRRHQEAARAMSGCHVLTCDQIWETASKCWDDVPDCKIARGFVQYWRIMSKVIAEGGGNSFVGRGGDDGLHCGVGPEFDDTDNGVKPSPRHPMNK